MLMRLCDDVRGGLHLRRGALAQYHEVPGTQARRSGLIRIEVKLQAIAGGYAHEDIVKQYLSSVLCIGHCNAILVLEPKAIGIARTHMDMA